MRVTVAILLTGALTAAGSNPAQAQYAPDKCTGGILAPGTGKDLLIDNECTVGGGKYEYRNVNIVSGGKLKFEEAANSLNLRIHFWAKSILVEYGGSLVAGSPANPFGAKGGVLTIHLYGKDETIYGPGQPGPGGVGIQCRSNNSATNPPCGIPANVWDANGAAVGLPGGPLGTLYTDNFYKYDALPFDDGMNTETKSVGYFGYKVLAVSEGGTLKLFGKKGAVYGVSLLPKDSGTSWVRLAATILGSDPGPGPAATSLTVASPVDWEPGDHIVVTTTDYLPNHSEELVICPGGKGNTINFDANYNAPNCAAPQGVKWTHNGEQFSLAALPSRLNITKTAAETRAAVGLLTRSIRIVSAGDALGEPFPSPSTTPGYYFGGHTIVRQGFAEFKVQGVEFRQLGQGGKIGHYPMHFHLARTTPLNTFVTDSSINESMTRWITVHATQGVTLQRNVGYLSIGHGFYLEDAVETGNQFYSNLGVFARAAVTNAQNPRNVPGLLASPDETGGLSVKFESDKNNPTVFWITNGWNDFQGNMAAGAGMCGVCYWEIPAAISGPARNEEWASYASEQTEGRLGSSPLMNFDGNSCTSAMTSFQTVGFTVNCPGAVTPFTVVVPVLNPLAPMSTASKDTSTCGPGTKWPLCPDGYYPKVDPGDAHQATQCPATGTCDDATAPLCTNGDKTNCLPTVINNYTTSFNWASKNFAGMWLRTRWHLVSNSFISDVQNAGITFVGGGDYTRSSAIGGLWELALKTVFAGQTQAADKDHGYASVLSPFNAFTPLKCDTSVPPGPFCVSKDNSFPLGPFDSFGVSEHMFNIYDGPANEDSNAYLAITKHDLGTKPASIYAPTHGIPKAVKVDTHGTQIPVGDCYIQNAAIAWKQPNGFYYPPTFHSNNLFFKDVDIRHYVIVPQFVDGTYQTNGTKVAKQYCTQASDMFNNYSGVDRQTVLTDDDGSLTGYAKTISVNQDPFFHAPIDGLECQTDGSVPAGGTARTSPYEYVTTVVYPNDATMSVSEPGKPVVCAPGPDYKRDPNWDSDCTGPRCFGVPLYRELLTNTELVGGKPPPTAEMPFIRMAGMALCQRETMTVNHGHYYVDLTASLDTQKNKWPAPGGRPLINVFIEEKTYDFFEVYATKDTEQTFKMFVGAGLDPTKVENDVKLIRVNIDTGPFVVTPGTGGDATTLIPRYNPTSGILTVKLNLSAYAAEFADRAKKLCVPETFCKFTSKCVGIAGALGNLTQAERDTTCGYAGKDIDCPADGCVGFSVKLPKGFMASDQTVTMGIPTQLAACFPKDANWNVTTALSPLAGSCKTAVLTPDFCP
ncbi:MAG: G8 domain-containing protein [Methylocella sp.]